MIELRGTVEPGFEAALGWADPESGIAYGYVRRRFGYPGTENARLGAAVMRAAAT